MPLISFKNVRFFKGSPPPAGRPPRPGEDGRAGIWRRFKNGPAPLIILSGIVLTVLLSSRPSRPLPVLREGQIAPADIIAPADFTLEDRETTEERRKNVGASILPVYDYPWKPGIQPAPEIIALNAWIRDYADKSGFVYLDYFSAVVDDKGLLRRGLSDEGLHPNASGYKTMAPLAEKAIARAIAGRP